MLSGWLWLSTRWCPFAYRTFLRWPLPRRCLMRSRSGDPDVWRVSIRFLGDPEEPPNMISHGTVEAPPSSTLHDLVQGIEHEGRLTSAAHGVEVIAYTSAPASSCMTAKTIGPRTYSHGWLKSIIVFKEKYGAQPADVWQDLCVTMLRQSLGTCLRTLNNISFWLFLPHMCVSVLCTAEELGRRPVNMQKLPAWLQGRTLPTLLEGSSTTDCSDSAGLWCYYTCCSTSCWWNWFGLTCIGVFHRRSVLEWANPLCFLTWAFSAWPKRQYACGDLLSWWSTFQGHTLEAHEIFVFGDQPLLAQFSSCSPAGLSGKLSAMPSVGTSLPPAQFNLTLSFGSEELVPIERLFKAFAPRTSQ